MNYSDLVSNIKDIKDRYDAERNKDRFNIFYALHKQHDEVNLHSRFISYLLAKDSGHGKGNMFAKLFFDLIFEDKNKLKSFFNDYEVIPNEYNKTEFEEIDILLVNRKLNHAIIIENKIFAKDSNHENKPKDSGYRGQLERYYNTIETGKYISENKTEPTKYACENIDIFYLSLKPPNEDSFKESKGNVPKHVCVKRLSYEYTIIPWLESCLKEIKDEYNNFLKKVINQYLILVKNMTNTNIPVEERRDLIKAFSDDLETSKYIVDNFKHIKWHTVADFLCLLKRKLESKYGKEKVHFEPKNDDERHQLITDLTHYNKDVNISIIFQIGYKTYYVSTLHNLSWGVIEPKEWWLFKSSSKLENIRFSDFLTDNTYDLIKKENMENVVYQIVEEISNQITIRNNREL